MAAKPGIYALLLGSGVSRSAEVPNGWEVVLDLVEKLYLLEKGDTRGDPEKWYADRYGSPPGYSSLLEALAKTPAERQALLQPYFEPTQQQREDSLKVPSAAHRAIASMVSGGYVRVIVTANFDRLMERALEAEGVSPMVISNPDQAEGAVPLAHRACSTSDCGSSFGTLRNRS